MSEQARCPQCDAEIPSGAPAGLCPKCLFQAGLDSQQPVAPQFPPTQPSPSPASRFEPPAPEELAARFPQLEILALLGRGGMGAVYKARQRGLDRLVALKILPPEVSVDPAFAERFTREARALAKLTHSNIVTVYDFGQAASARHASPDPASRARRGSPDPAVPADGLFYFLMEYVDGVNLRQAIQAGDMTPQNALAIVPQICAALQFAHDEGIVHRDIKPENILIDKRGRVKIADFGLAKLLGQDASDHSLTATHQVMGTLRYMAPEQMQGSREVDHRADIYSLGVVFYELLTGELPMGKFAPPSKRVQVDVRLDEVVLRALEQEPEQRYQHASEVKSDVEAIGAGGRMWLLPRTATLLAALVGGLLVAGPWQSVEMRAPFTQGSYSLWFLSMGYESSLGLATGVMFAIALLMTLVTFPMRRAAIPAATILFGLLIAALMISYGTDPPLVDQPEVPDVAERIRALNPSLQFEGSTDLDVVLAARKARLIDYWQVVIPAFYVCLAMALLTVIAATFDFVLLRQSPSVESSHEKEKERETRETGTGPVSLAGPHLVQGPADCLLLAAGVAFVTACGVALWLGVTASSGNHFTTSMIRGNLIGMSAGLAIYSVFVGVAGLMLRRLRARLYVVMELRNIPVWPVVIPLWLGMPAALWVAVTLFRDDVRRAFEAAAEQRAEKTGTTPVSLHHTSAEIQMQIRGPAVLLRDDIKATFHTQTKSQSRPQPPDRIADAVPPLFPKRPKLVPVLATFNLVGAILLMLVCAMEEPAEFARSVPRLWQVWETVDAVLGFSMAAGMFAASIGLFVWKPWARKLTLGVCVFGLASFVFDAPYLARFALPDMYAEIHQTMAAEGIEPDMADFMATVSVVVFIGGMMVPGLACLIGQLVYFTRPRVVAAFESRGERYGKFIEWLFTGIGAVVGVLSVFGPLALLLGLAALLNQERGGQPIDSSVHPAGNRADSITGEVWSGNKDAEIVMFWGSICPTVSDQLAQHLGLDPSQRQAMNQAFEMYFREFKALEEQNTRHETDANGHQITTIAEFRQQVPALAERFWSELDSALDGQQLTLGRKTVGLGMGMFESANFGYRIEIWRVGQINPWYHWKESYPGMSSVPVEVTPYSGPELPEKYRRFWKEPATTKADAATSFVTSPLVTVIA
ncbi:MAG: serine/threonine protein kinase [Planctomycetia bacterium]|nr:serine/threonine protein kinase [Planctomycetia bacterium]